MAPPMRVGLLTLFLLGCVGLQRPPNVAELDDAQVALPAPTAFTFGPGDSLSIWVWRHEDLTVDVTVAPDGMISYPLVGRVQVAGRTYDDLVKTLQDGIDEYYVDAQVSVNIKQVTNQKVMVIGEVATPQVLQITNDLSLIEALTRTGGINPEAQTRNVLVVRGGMEKPTLFTVDVDALYGRGDMTQMVYLQRGDIVYVPTTTITNVERFFRSISGILSPAVSGSAIYRNLFFAGSTVNTNSGE
jgi:polysaccharide export outer membrane protein